MKLIPILLLALAASACTYEDIPQGTIGKVLSPDGFNPEILPPSRVDVGRKGHLVLVETRTKMVNEKVTVRMKDKMDLITNVRFRLRMGTKPSSRNLVFNDVEPGGDNRITLLAVYGVYGKMIVNRVTREVLSAYRMDEVQSNFKKISADIYAQVRTEFKPTPLQISDVALGKLIYPDTINVAILAAASRKLDIAKAEADVLVKLKKLEGQEKVAAGKYRIAMHKAKLDRDSNRMIAAGITDKLIRLRELENQALLIENLKGNQNVIYLPHGFNAMPTMALK